MGLVGGLFVHSMLCIQTIIYKRITEFKILSNLLAISKLLNYTDKQLYDFCIDKMNKTLEMISK